MASNSVATNNFVSSSMATSSVESTASSNNVVRKGFSLRGWNQKALIALVLFWCSFHLPAVAAAEVVDPPEFKSSDNIDSDSNSKNHVAFNFAMQVVLFVLTKNFHIGAFLITVLPVVSLVKLSMDKHKTAE